MDTCEVLNARESAEKYEIRLKTRKRVSGKYLTEFPSHFKPFRVSLNG